MCVKVSQDERGEDVLKKRLTSSCMGEGRGICGGSGGGRERGEDPGR